MMPSARARCMYLPLSLAAITATDSPRRWSSSPIRKASSSAPQMTTWPASGSAAWPLALACVRVLTAIGLEIDLEQLVAAGPPVLLTGAFQVPLCFALGLAFFYWLGFRNQPGQYGLLYLAACMSMSSTLIVVKLLYDKLELDTLPGRITLGILVCQDLWAVAMLAIQPNLLHPDAAPLLASLLKGLLLILWSLAV